MKSEQEKWQALIFLTTIWSLRKMSKKKLESLLSYQERLAREKGLPPSRLMLQHAAVVLPLPASKEFQCDQCEFS